jgi:hypothetical protein
VIIQERLAGNDSDFHYLGRTGGETIEQPFPGKVFPPIGHIGQNLAKGARFRACLPDKVHILPKKWLKCGRFIFITKVKLNNSVKFTKLM